MKSKEQLLTELQEVDFEEVWFEFGKSTDGLRVDLSNGYDDILTNIPKEQAKVVSEKFHNVLWLLEDCYRYLSNELDSRVE